MSAVYSRVIVCLICVGDQSFGNNPVLSPQSHIRYSDVSLNKNNQVPMRRGFISYKRTDKWTYPETSHICGPE